LQKLIPIAKENLLIQMSYLFAKMNHFLATKLFCQAGKDIILITDRLGVLGQLYRGMEREKYQLN